MLKKILNIGISLLLILSTTGVTLSKHYCGGTLVSIAVNKEAKKCCGASCSKCHSESITLKVTDTFLAASLAGKPILPFSAPGTWMFVSPESFHTDIFYSTLPQTLLKAPPLIIVTSSQFLQIFRC